MAAVYLYFSHHETTILSNEIRLRGVAICNNLVASSEDLLVMKDDLALAKLVYDTQHDNAGILYCFIVDNNLRIWAHTDVELVNEVYSMPHGMAQLGSRSMLAQPFQTEEGVEILEIAMPIMVRNTKIGEAHLALSLNAIEAAAIEVRKGIAVVTVVIMLIGVIGILVLVSFIIGSLKEVTDDIEAIGDGDLDRRVVTKRRDEIGRITHSVKNMARKLKKAQEELVEKERMKKEMQIAKEIQQSLLPRSLQTVPGFKIEAHYQSAREVGGDYYDLIRMDKEHFGIVIGDVSGKGVAGSLIMAMVRSIMKIEAAKSLSPRLLLTAVHSSLKNDIPEGMFMTLFYVVFDLHDNVMRYCSAGHNPAFLFSAADEKIRTLKPEGMPLGISLVEEKDFVAQLKEGEKEFKKGEILFLYTDGVTEATNSMRQQFGEQRLEQLLIAHKQQPPGLLSKTIINAIWNFTGKEPQSDDITFVIIQKE